VKKLPVLCIVRKLEHIRYIRNIRVFAYQASIFQFFKRRFIYKFSVGFILAYYTYTIDLSSNIDLVA